MTIAMAATSQNVTLYEHSNFGGAFKTLSVGQHRILDFNDVASSIRVPPGMVAMIYEHAADNLGYGIYVDLLEDCSDLSQYNFNDKVSYVNVFMANNGTTHVWARNAMVNGQFIPGHWERRRVNPGPPNTVAVVAPPLAGPVNTNPSVLAVNGPNTTITSLGMQTNSDRARWEYVMAEQMGVYGNDFRGIEEIGSAAIERASNNPVIPDNFNFWYPQKNRNDHRAIVYFKRTLAGKVKEAKQVNIQGTFADFDVCVNITPNPKFMYMIDEGHPREYTDLMSRQYTLSAHQSGKPDCNSADDLDDFTHVEAEIAEDFWPQGNHTFGRARLADLVLSRVGRDICVYGPWIYDAGHCCHPEIHPSEQLWWHTPEGNDKRYSFNVLCDASRRFFWRHQMDDGTKLKPWAAPPVKGLFAIAFEYTLPRLDVSAINSTKQFEVSIIQEHNVANFPNANQTHNLIYQGKNIVSFVPRSSHFKVSFEGVGTVPGAPDKIRGFLVIETAVGKLTQIRTELLVSGGITPTRIKIPMGSAPEIVPQQFEDKFFKKEEGNFLFTVLEKSVRSGGVVLDVIRTN